MQYIFIYQGGGFLQGIPARDLTKEEAEQLSDAQTEAALESGLYKKKAPKKTKKAGEGS